MTVQDIRSIITSFVADSFQNGSAEVQIDENSSFLDLGLVDSMRVLELVDFLEQRFSISVEDSELVPENLDSIGNIFIYLKSKGVPDVGQ